MKNPQIVSGPQIDPDASLLSSVSASAYTEEDLVCRFAEVLDSLDLRQEIVELGCGLNGFFQRGRVLRELNALCVSLWKLALEQSFPEQAETVFRHYLEKSPRLSKGRRREKQIRLIEGYCALSAEKKVSDFTPVSQYMTQKLNKKAENEKVLLFKFSLTIRKLYQVIFTYLI